MMKEGNFLYEGKAKEVFETDDPHVVLIRYKDDATAFDGLKKGTIKDKGIVNNRVSNMLFKLLEEKGIETHLLEEIDERNTLVKRVEIVPIEVVVRNVIAGSLAERIGKEEGTELKNTIIELYYKDDELHDPMINEYHVRAMELASNDEVQEMHRQAEKINTILREFFDSVGIILVDFKLEFGRYKDYIILADEISPDTCRLWDKESLEKLDKDRFRRNMGKEEEAYQEVVQRIEKALK